MAKPPDRVEQIQYDDLRLVRAQYAHDNSDIRAVAEDFDKDWDAIIIGDGSGYGSPHCAGWASCCVSRYWRDRIVRWGAETGLSVVDAEILAGLAGLESMWTRGWFQSLRKCRKQRTSGLVCVLVLSDSTLAVNIANNHWKTGHKLLQPPVISRLRIVGDILAADARARWYWNRRNTLRLHVDMDELSRRARQVAQSLLPMSDSLLDHNPHTQALPKRSSR